MCDSEKMVWKAFLHIVINYRIEMTVGDTLKFFLLYALEMTPYIFWHRENYLNPLFPSKGDIWEEMGLCLFTESLLGQRSVRAEGQQPWKQVSSAGDTDEASGWLLSLKTLQRHPGWEGGKVSSHLPSSIWCLLSASGCWRICKDAGGEQ